MVELMLILGRWQWLGELLARLVVGALFLITGFGKLTVPAKRDRMRSTISDAGVPLPWLSASIMSWIELVAGAALLVGFLTPVAAFLIAAMMVGALATTKLPAVETASFGEWLGQVLFIPDTLYLVIAIWLLLAGPGWLSLDNLLFTVVAG